MTDATRTGRVCGTLDLAKERKLGQSIDQALRQVVWVSLTDRVMADDVSS